MTSLGPAGTYSYDPNTLIGQTRFMCSDTQIDGASNTCVWTDEELQFCLNRNGSIPELAAAYALRSGAANFSKLSAMTSFGYFASDRRKTYQAMIDTAENLRKNAPVPPAVQSPYQVFSTDSPANIGCGGGSMDGW